MVALTGHQAGLAACDYFFFNLGRVTTDLADAATLPSWCPIHKRFDLTQADFAQRWCLGDVLAHVSASAAGSPGLCVHVPAVLSPPAVPTGTP